MCDERRGPSIGGTDYALFDVSIAHGKSWSASCAEEENSVS